MARLSVFLCVCGLCVALLPSCRPNLAAISAGHVGCAEDEITISEEHVGMTSTTWTAACRDKVYYCSGAGNTLGCKEDTSDSKVAAPPPSPVPVREKTAEDGLADNAMTKKKWVKYELAQCGLEARFPDVPETAVRQLDVGGKHVTLYVAGFNLPGDAGYVSVSCTELPKSKRTPTELLDAARDGVLKSTKANLQSESEILGGREVQFDVSGAGSIGHFLLFKDRLITALVVPISAIGEAGARRFLESIRVADRDGGSTSSPLAAMKKTSSRNGGTTRRGRVLPNDACPRCRTMMKEARSRLKLPSNGEDIAVPSASHLKCPKCGYLRDHAA